MIPPGNENKYRFNMQVSARAMGLSRSLSIATEPERDAIGF
jgi:hypothetical protein